MLLTSNVDKIGLPILGSAAEAAGLEMYNSADPGVRRVLRQTLRLGLGLKVLGMY